MSQLQQLNQLPTPVETPTPFRVTVFCPSQWED